MSESWIEKAVDVMFNDPGDCVARRSAIKIITDHADAAHPQAHILRAYHVLCERRDEVSLAAAVCLEDAVRILIGKDNPDGTPNPKWNEEWNQ